MGVGAPRFNFDFVRAGIDRLRGQATEASWGPALHDLEARWQKDEWAFALRGKAGHDDAGAYAGEVDALERRATGHRGARRIRSGSPRNSKCIVSSSSSWPNP
jgi:hypothetical protein